MVEQKFQPKPVFPRFFETVNLIYNLFQTSLAYSQQLHPEFTSRILTTQRVLLLADTIALGRDYVELRSHIKVKAKTKKEKDELKYLIAAALTSSLFAATGVFLISRYAKPSSNLKEILQTAAALSPKELENVNVYWNTPHIHKLAQFLALNRIAVNLYSTLTASSRKSLLHVTTVFLQTLTLYKNSQLPWIKFEKTFTRSDAPLQSSNGENYHINTLTAELHFLPISDETSSALKSTYDYTTNFFNQCSSWQRYWEIQTKKGLETSRKLMYDVTVQPSKLVGDKPPYIDGITVSALDDSFGRATVNLLTRRANR